MLRDEFYIICILLKIFVDVWISLVIFALLFVIFQCMSPGKVRKMISMFSYTWMYIDFALFICLKNPLTPNLCLINASAFTSPLFGFCFRENTDQYVFLCFAHTHFTFIWSFIFFTVTGMIHYCSMYLSIASKWGQKNESLFLRQKWMRQVFYFYIFCRTCNTTIYFFIYLNFFNTQAIVPYVNFIERFLML